VTAEASPGLGPVRDVWGPEKAAVGDTVVFDYKNKRVRARVTWVAQAACYAEIGEAEHRLPWSEVVAVIRRGE